MLDEKNLIEKSLRENQEIGFFSNLENIEKGEIEESVSFAKKIKETWKDFDQKSREEQKKTIEETKEEIGAFLKKQKDKDKIFLLIPLIKNTAITCAYRKGIIKNIFEKETEDKKADIEIILDELISNLISHSSPESQFALVSFKKEDGEKIKEISTLNFSNKEISSEFLNFLNNESPKDKEEELINYSNYDLERINECSEEEIEKICHQRGLEIVAGLAKNIKYQKIDNPELGLCHKFSVYL